ncbi:MAG: O-methyltransferase [Fidelibacterota bacterium]
MDFLPREIERYAVEHTEPEPELYRRLTEETYAREESPQMLSGPLVGTFLQLLVRLTGGRRALDIGTFTGYSALKLAEAVAPGGRVYTCEIDRRRIERARKFFQEAPWGDRIEILEGPALASIQSLKPPFDVIFIDADKPNYLEYYKRAVRLAKTGGVVVLDNSLWSGRVLEPGDDRSRAISRTNDFIHRDERVINLLVPIRDGLMVAYKK